MVKSYWTILNKQVRFYTVGKEGWEIHIRNEEYIDHLGKVKRYQYKSIPPNFPREARADLKRKISRDKRIAQAVNTYEEYRKLWARIDREDWDFIEENNLTGGDLIHWAYNTHTADEYYRLLRYN